MGATGDTQLALPARPDSVPRARHWLRTLLASASMSSAVIDDAELLLSELVSNVLRHTTSDLAIDVVITPARVLITVCDEDPNHRPILRPMDPTRPGGNGIRLVESFSSDWGVDDTASGKATWFTLQVLAG